MSQYAILEGNGTYIDDTIYTSTIYTYTGSTPMYTGTTPIYTGTTPIYTGTTEIFLSTTTIYPSTTPIGARETASPTDVNYEPIIMATMASLGVILNFLSICTIVCGRRINAEVKIQLTNLAIADLLACLVPGFTEQLWIRKTAIPCQTLSFIGYGAFYAGPLWNMVISLERVVIVFFPFKARFYRRKHKIFIATCVWITALGSAIEYIATKEKWHGHNDKYCLSQDQTKPNHTKPRLYFWLEVCKYGIPALITVASYLSICVKLCGRSHIGESLGSQRAVEERKKNQVLRMLMVNALVTVLTVTPYYQIYMAITEVYTDLPMNVWDHLEVSLSLLQLINVFITPIIYFLFNSSYRRDTLDLFRSSYNRLSSMRVTSTFNSSTTTATSSV